MVLLSEGINPENPDFHTVSEFDQWLEHPLPKPIMPKLDALSMALV